MVHLKLRNLRTAPVKEEPATMAQKLSRDEELHERITTLNPRMQEAFLRAVERLYERESQLMLKFIAESRATLGMTKQEFDDEQEVLRETQYKISESHEAERRKSESRRPKSSNSLRPGDYVCGSDMESLSTDTTSEHSDTTISFVNESPKTARSASPRPTPRGRALSPRPPRAVSPLPQKQSASTRQRSQSERPPIPLRSQEVSAALRADPGAHSRGPEATVHVPEVTVHRHGWGDEPLEPVKMPRSHERSVTEPAPVVKTHKHLVRLDSEVFALPGRPSSASSASTASKSPAMDGRSITRISLMEQPDDEKYVKEKDELMRELSNADGRMANERQRQATLLEMKKTKQKQKKEENEEMVNELLEQTMTHLRHKAEDKERQGQKIKEKLEQKKREKTELELLSHHGHQENRVEEEISVGEGVDEESCVVIDSRPRQRRRDQVEVTEL